MTTELRLACRCGEFSATVTGVAPSKGNRVVCYCDDCQLFQYHLGNEDTVLDSHGGTDIFQVSSATVRFESGQDKLACLRLRPGGLVRWYTSCCSTPLGNSLATPKLPFFGIIRKAIRSTGDARDVNEALGPVLCGVHGRYAVGQPGPFRVYPKAPLWLLLRFMRKMLRWKLRRDGKLSPFFDAHSGRLVVKPVVLDSAELDRAIEKRGAAQ